MSRLSSSLLLLLIKVLLCSICLLGDTVSSMKLTRLLGLASFVPLVSCCFIFELSFVTVGSFFKAELVTAYRSSSSMSDVLLSSLFIIIIIK